MLQRYQSCPVFYFFEHPTSLLKRESIFAPLSISKARCAGTIIFCMKIRHHQNLSKIRFQRGWHHSVAWRRHHNQYFCQFDIFFLILNFFGVFYAKLSLKSCHHHHHAITWSCDVIGDKESSDFALVFCIPFGGKSSRILFVAKFIYFFI